jgi:molybdenum cofactor guanylyltransferase
MSATMQPDATVDTDFSAVILAGGSARRLGGRDKAAIVVDGTPLLARVLAAASRAVQRIVVGPQRSAHDAGGSAGVLVDSLLAGVRWTREMPAGGGPVAATAAGLALVEHTFVALLAVDQPYLTLDAIEALRIATHPSTVDGAVFVDPTGRRQLLCGVWRTASLRAAVADMGDPAGRSMRALVASLRVTEVSWSVAGRPPYLDLDTMEQVIAATKPE